MSYQFIDGIPVWGDPLQNAVDQMKNCMKTAYKGAMTADHHLGYAVPIGGVLAYKDCISPSGIGFDIACGNKAVKTNLKLFDIQKDLPRLMDEIFNTISFGVGRKNDEKVDHALFDHDSWNIKTMAPLKQMAREQLGTVGSGNHYVDVFTDEDYNVWIGVHFGSRGLGHKVATHYITAGGGVDAINADPVVLNVHSELGAEYIQCIDVIGQYAYAGRDWVCSKVASILGATILDEVHNHHNFAWYEKHAGEMLWVVRKGATPCFPGQRGFVGGTMGENSVIIEGVQHDDCFHNLYSTVHGAGRIMSRTEASGKSKWRKGKKTKVSSGKVTQEMMTEWVTKAHVELRGAGVDESPHCYKRLNEVLNSHKNTIKINTVLKPIGVCMAGDIEDPYKD